MTKPNQIDAPVYGFHPVHGELIVAKDVRKAIEHVLNQHKPNTELVGEVTQYCMENNIGLGQISTKALMAECDRLSKERDELAAHVERMTIDIDKANGLLSLVYQSGIKLDELEEPIHDFLVNHEFAENPTQSLGALKLEQQAKAIEMVIYELDEGISAEDAAYLKQIADEKRNQAKEQGLSGGTQ